MTQNPYAPPTAPVADIAGAPPVATHPHVLLACKLMWASMVVSLASSIPDLFKLPGSLSIVAAIISLLIGTAIGFAIVWWFTIKLKAGRNWMRLLLTVFQVVGIVFVLLFWDFYKTAFSLMAPDPVRIVLMGAQWLLSLVAVVLINLPGARAWFAAVKQSRLANG
jgi:hypothetical protein